MHLASFWRWGFLEPGSGLLLYGWKYLLNSARSHWLLRGHMTSNNETVSRQNLWASNIAKCMTSEGNSALLPANVDQRPPLQRGLMNFQLYKKTGISMFSSVSPRKTLRFQENKIVCFPLDQSLRIYYSLWMECLLTAGQPKSCISPAHVKTWSERKNVNFTRDNFVWRHVQDLSTRVFPGSGIWLKYSVGSGQR